MSMMTMLLIVKMMTWLTLQHLLQKQRQSQKTLYILITQEKWGTLKLINHLNGLNGGKTTDSGESSDVLPDNEIQVELELSEVDAAEASLSIGGLEKNDETVAGHLPESTD